MRVLAVVTLLFAAACASAPPRSYTHATLTSSGPVDPRSITPPAEFQRAAASAAPVSRETIRLGTVETSDAPYAPPTAIGGGPPAQ